MVDLRLLSDSDLLRLRADIEIEATRRGLALTVGELGERLAIYLFRQRPDLPVLAPAPKGTKIDDAISRDGERYSIKTLRRARRTGKIYPNREDPQLQLFEQLLLIELADDSTLSRMVLLN